MKLINKTTNGQLSFCKCCNVFQLEFGNILFSFPQKDYMQLVNYVKGIDGKEYIQKNAHLSFNRKIFLSFPVKNLFFCLNLAELEELKTLLFIHKRKEDPCEKQLALLHIFAN